MNTPMKSLFNRDIEHLDAWTMKDILFAIGLILLTLWLVLGGE